MNININLSEKQKEIVSITSGAICVEAVAGSGKTRVLTARIRNILKLTSKKILALTFTNKAAEEMRDRLADIEKIKERSFIGTFHGFCQFALENHGISLGIKEMPQIFEDEGDRLRILEAAIKMDPILILNYQNRDSKERRAFGMKVLDNIAKIKRDFLQDLQIPSMDDTIDVTFLYSSYQEILSSLNAIDYDDLLLLTYRLFSENPNVASLYRRGYPYIFVDEAQDLNNAQYQILLALTMGENNNVMMVGDPNQSIFAFNGSSPDFLMKNFINDFSPRIFELKENYRSSIKVIKAAERIIPDSLKIENIVIEGEFTIHSAKDEKDEALWVSNKIAELIDLGVHQDIEGKIVYEKIAVLARNRYLFNRLQETFIEKEIPFWYKSSAGPFKIESDVIKIFDYALRIKLNPRDALHKMNLLKLLGLKALKFDDLSILIDSVESTLNNRILLSVLKLKADGSNFRSSLDKIQKYICSDSTTFDDNERNRIINDVIELKNRWTNYARKTDKESLQSFKIAFSLGQTEPLTQPKGVTLSTIHTMKGQEYDIVFIIGLDQETFPDYRAVRVGGNEMLQERNNLYVAFTRAKRFLYVSWPRQRVMPWGDIKIRARSEFLTDFEG